jgi:hypothetical protein
MNTLNFKVLLSKYGFIIFLRAIGIYLLLSFPAMVAFPPMYLVSAAYALSVGWIAAFVFWLTLYTLQFLGLSPEAKLIVLYIVVAAGVTLAFQALEVAGAQEQIWQSGPFLLFPAVAILSGWISLFMSRRKIQKLFANTVEIRVSTVTNDNLSPTENIVN